MWYFEIGLNIRFVFVDFSTSRSKPKKFVKGWCEGGVGVLPDPRIVLIIHFEVIEIEEIIWNVVLHSTPIYINQQSIKAINFLTYETVIIFN